jgi:hypothetical protein
MAMAYLEKVLTIKLREISQKNTITIMRTKKSEEWI